MEQPSVTEKPTAAEPAETVLEPIDLAPPTKPNRAPSVSESLKQPAATLPPAPAQPEEPTTKLAEPAAAEKEASIGMPLHVAYAVIMSLTCLFQMQPRNAMLG